MSDADPLVDYPSDALRRVEMRAENRFVEKADKYGPGRNWRAHDGAEMANAAHGKLIEAAVRITWDDYDEALTALADAFNYLLFEADNLLAYHLEDDGTEPGTDRGTGSTGAEQEPADDRPRFPDTVEEWKQVAVDEDVALMLEAEEQTVFVAHVETDEFDSGEKWISNGISETGARQNSFATGENLIDRWFREAVRKSRAWQLDPEETPLEVERHV